MPLRSLEDGRIAEVEVEAEGPLSGDDKSGLVEEPVISMTVSVLLDDDS